jgi:siroheme synthase-like protein
MTRYYSIALNLADRRCVVVGGGAVAERKVHGLLASDARVCVISPQVNPTLRRWAAEGRIALHEREVISADLEGAALVIAATDDAAVNARAAQSAGNRGGWVNAVDDPAHSDFIAPAVLRRGDLTIAISTGGASPALAAALRQQFEAQFGDEYTALVELLGALRARAKAEINDPAQREQFWQTLIARDLDALLDLLRRGEQATARQRVEENLAQWKKPQGGM